jgi:hypothetical protein
MEINFSLDDLLRDAEENCRGCGGAGVAECQLCHGSGKTLTWIGRSFFAFLRRHLNDHDQHATQTPA